MIFQDCTCAQPLDKTVRFCAAKEISKHCLPTRPRPLILGDKIGLLAGPIQQLQDLLREKLVPLVENSVTAAKLSPGLIEDRAPERNPGRPLESTTYPRMGEGAMQLPGPEQLGAQIRRQTGPASHAVRP